jgi:hypothetical protein
VGATFENYVHRDYMASVPVKAVTPDGVFGEFPVCSHGVSETSELSDAIGSNLRRGGTRRALPKRTRNDPAAKRRCDQRGWTVSSDSKDISDVSDIKTGRGTVHESCVLAIQQA